MTEYNSAKEEIRATYDDATLLKIADEAYDMIMQKDYDKLLYLIKQGWEQKKNISSVITGNQVIKDIDKVLDESETVLAHRLCGAGNGGFFLTFSKKDTLKIPYESVRIDIEAEGVYGQSI